MLSPGERVNLCRTEKNWSQRELAEKLVAMKMTPNVSDPVYEKRLRAAQTQVSAWEKGLYQPSVTSTRQLAQIFGVSVEWFLSGKTTLKQQHSTLPLLEPLVFLEIESVYDIKHPYFPQDYLDAGLPVNVPERLSENADFLIKAPNNCMSFDGIWKDDYVAISQYRGPEGDDGQVEVLEIGSSKIFLVLVWRNGEPFTYHLARVREVVGRIGYFLVFNSFNTFPVEYSRKESYITVPIGEVRGWMHFENPVKQRPAIYHACSLTRREDTSVLNSEKGG